MSDSIRKPTETAIKRYIACGGVRCLFCDSENLEAFGEDSLDSKIMTPVVCHACGKTWRDVWTLSGVAIS